MELGVVEQLYAAVREVLDGATVVDVARRNGMARQRVHGGRGRVEEPSGGSGLSTNRRHSPIRANAESVQILRFPGTFSTGKYPQPKPFGGMGKPVDEDGFSDHFPIGMQIIESD